VTKHQIQQLRIAVFSFQQAGFFRKPANDRQRFGALCCLLARTRLHRTSVYAQFCRVFFYAIVPGKGIILKKLAQKKY
jgi:hypothetical protein